MSKSHSRKLADIVEDTLSPDPPPVIELTQADLNQLAPYLGRNLRTKEDLMIAISNLSTVNCEGVEIILEPGLLQRLKSRCIRRAFPGYLQETIKRLLHSEVGW